ncbi:protein Mis18-beta isoform X3 [Patagioenas fasciata]|uniref:protein Mis18-beta isoform X3 n=1 Tax=Patagioenas fasciata TaxID=372321 RepID=UPI003A98EC79
MKTQICEARSSCEARKAGAALERRAGEDGGTAEVAGASRRAAHQRDHRSRAAVDLCCCRAGLTVAVFIATFLAAFIATFLAAGRGLATAAAGAAAAGLRRVPLPQLLGGAGGLAAPVRAGGAAARPPCLLQSHQRCGLGGFAPRRTRGTAPGLCLRFIILSVMWLNCGLNSLFCLQCPGVSPRLILFLQGQHQLLFLKRPNDNRSF